MQIWEIVLLGLALSMDACTVAITYGIEEPKMSVRNVLIVGLSFGVLLFLMPLLGGLLTGLITGFFEQSFEDIAGWIALAMLVIVGGRTLLEGVRSLMDTLREKKAEKEKREGAGMSSPSEEEEEAEEDEPLTVKDILTQSLATALDTFAIGVALQMGSITPTGLSIGLWGATAVIGVMAMGLSIGAVYLGRRMGEKLVDKTQIVGGALLLLLAIRLLIESL